jgi:hypothetical protein
MCHCIPMEYGKIQIQTFTHGCQDWMVPDVFQNVMSKLGAEVPDGKIVNVGGINIKKGLE